MREEVAAIVPEARATTSWGTPALDLAAGGARATRRGGVRDIVLAGGCTRESPECFSHRRDGVTGRFAGVIVSAVHRD